MGYFMVHLKIAENLLKNNINIKDTTAFYKGSLAPDAIMFREGCLRSDKSTTHFCIGDEGWGYYTNYEQWENNLNLNIVNYVDMVNSDFLFGYYAHILTDIAYTSRFSRFWTPTRITGDKEYIDDYLKDIGEIDSRLFGSLENKEILWSEIKNSKNYCLQNLFNDNDLSILIDEMINNIYYNRKSNPNHEFKVVTPTDMLDFIDKMVSKISCSQFKVQA
ncbi:zinc dependent phospholipase C family protein [Clostridium sp. UBA4548]|uniref:zinc dependent phospholipase C family protein n=1 Tax=Clostridium sp. UBA4548 TaxID=1946361 RepID=UPI0025C0C075|nr:zinc dependent phospholipase C family protein [Clostridium sp. UBA4548]